MNFKMESSSVWNGGELTKDMFNELVEGFYKGAVSIRDKARALVHIGPGKPKHLRDTIRARKGRYGAGKRLIHGVVSGEYETAIPAAYVFAGSRDEDVYWQWMLEFGTYDKPAYPFMRPAVDSSFDAVLAETERAGRRAINKRRRAHKWGKGHA